MAQPPIEVDQITLQPAFDGTNISNVDAVSLGGSGAANFAPLASPSFTGTVNATDMFMLNSSGDTRIRIQGAAPGDSARLNFYDGGGGIRGQMFLRGSDNVLLISSSSADLYLSTSFDGADIVLVTHPANNDNIILDGQRFPNQDGTIGQILSTNGSGVLSWIAPPSSGVEKVMMTGMAQTPVTNGLTTYSGPSGRVAGQTFVSGIVNEIIPFRPGNTGTVTLRDFFVKAPNNTSNGSTVITIVKNALPTAVAVTIPSTSGSVAFDIVNTITVTPNDVIMLRWVSSAASGTFAEASWGFTVEQ